MDSGGIAAGAPLECPYCRATQLVELEGDRPCAACGRMFAFYRFRPAVPAPPAVEGDVGRTPCFQHARNLSTDSCSRCGSFLCALCATRAEGQVLCPACFARLHSEGRLATTRRELVAWGRLTMVLGVAAVMLPLYGCGFGAIALGLGAYGLSRMKKQNTAGGKGWVITGMSLGFLGLLLWVVVVAQIFRKSWPARAAVFDPPAAPAAPRRQP